MFSWWQGAAEEAVKLVSISCTTVPRLFKLWSSATQKVVLHLETTLVLQLQLRSRQFCHVNNRTTAAPTEHSCTVRPSCPWFGIKEPYIVPALKKLHLPLATRKLSYHLSWNCHSAAQYTTLGQFHMPLWSSAFRNCITPTLVQNVSPLPLSISHATTMSRVVEIYRTKLIRQLQCHQVASFCVTRHHVWILSPSATLSDLNANISRWRSTVVSAVIQRDIMYANMCQIASTASETKLSLHWGRPVGRYQTELASTLYDAAFTFLLVALSALIQNAAPSHI